MVRGNQLDHPFADASWHEPVDDEDEQIVVTDESLDDEPAFDVNDERDVWPDETLFHEPDDWDSLGEDGDIEAA